MRLYVFTNCYLSSIQKGIQTAHVVAEMAELTENVSDFHKWAQFHKTIIVLDGGNNYNLNQISKTLKTADHNFLWAEFWEDEDSMGGMLTAVGILFDNNAVYAVDAFRTGGNIDGFNTSLTLPEKMIIEFVADSKLAI
jgi:hypothetical protein